MALKSIIDVEVDPKGSFAAFTKLFEKYQRALKSQPAAWALVQQKIDGTRSSFDKVVDRMAAANVQAKLQEQAQARADRLTRTTAERWAAVARSTKESAVNVRDMTLSVLRFGYATARYAAGAGVVGGLLGGGGLFGLDRLASGVSATRRSGLGLGIGYGDQRAFSTNFSRLVDPEGFLGSVAGAKLDVTKRVGLLGAGLSQGEINGDTGATSVALLRRLKTIADQTNPALYAQVLQSRRLDQFAGPEDLQRLRNTSQGEFGRLLQSYGRDRGAFNVGGVAERWQDFSTQMSRAGEKIEAVFVRGLTPLIPGLTKLSESVAKAVDTLLSSDKLKGWLESFGRGIEKFAVYVGSDEFDGSVRGFVEGVGAIGKAAARVARWFTADEADKVDSDSEGIRVDRMRRRKASGVDSAGSQFADLFRGSVNNNPGNIRPAGATSGFQSYASPEAGLRAVARQLQIYQERYGIDTVSGIVSRYAPASENDTARYIGNVSRRTGLDPNAHLNLSDPAILSKLVAAIVSNEQRPGAYDRYKDAKVVVEIIKPTGSDTAVTVNGVKGQ